MNQYYSQSNSEQWQKQKRKDFCSKNKHLFRTMAQSARWKEVGRVFFATATMIARALTHLRKRIEQKGTDAWRHLAKWLLVKAAAKIKLAVVSDEIIYFRRVLSGKQLQLIFMKLSCISLNQFIHSFVDCVDYNAKFHSIFCWCINKPPRYG